MNTTLAVIGLGYVGLPLAVTFAQTFPTIGFDLDPFKIDRLAQAGETTGEMSVFKNKLKTAFTMHEDEILDHLDVMLDSTDLIQKRFSRIRLPKLKSSLLKMRSDISTMERH